MSDVLKLTARLLFDGKQFDAGLKGAEQQADRTAKSIGKKFVDLADSLERVGSQMSVAITAPLVAFGALSLRTAGQFESSMNRVRATTGAVGQDFKQLENLAKELGATTAFSASQAADAMNALAQAGFNVEDITSALPGVLQLAAAGTLSLEEAASIAATTLTSFGLEAGEVGRVNDVLAKTASAANTDVRNLAEGFRYVAPIANGLGFSFEETTAALGQLSNAGIDASSAGTALRSILTQLATESDDLGISIKDSSGNMLPLVDILAQLEERGYTAEEAMMQFGETGGPGLTALISIGTESLRGLNDQLENAGGTAERMAATQMEGLNGALAELSSAFEALQIAIAESGLQAWFEGIVLRTTKFIQGLSELNPAVLKVATVFGIVVAAIPPLLLAFVQVVRGIQAVQAAFVAFRTVVLAMSGPKGWLILAIAAIGTLLVGAILRATDADSRLARSMGVTRQQAIAYREAIEETSSRAEILAYESSKVATEMETVGRSITDSTGSVDDLRAAVAITANQLQGPAKQAFIDYAEQAINSGEDLKTVGARIADKAKRDSLISQVNTLAQGLEGDGRIAFENYALRAIAMADTAEGAFVRIMQGWARVQNAPQITALAEVIVARRRQIAELEANLPGAEERMRNREMLGEITALEYEIQTLQNQIRALSGANIDYATTVQNIVNPAVNDLGDDLDDTGDSADGAGNKTSDAAKLIEGSIAAARAEVNRLKEALENAADDETRLRLDLDLQAAEANLARLLAAIEEARRQGAAIPVPMPAVGVSVAGTRPVPGSGATVSVAPTRPVAPGVSVTVTDLQALEDRTVRLTEAQFALGETTRAQVLAALNQQVELLTLLRGLTVEGSEANLRYTEALVRATAERDRAAAAVIAETRALNDANAARSAEATQAAQLLTWSGEVTQAKREAAIAEQQLAEATAAAMQLNLGYSEGLVGTAADAVAAAEAYVTLQTALAGVGEATDQQVVTGLLGLEAAIQQQRATLDPYSAEYAQLTERLIQVRGELEDYATEAERAAEIEANATLTAATANREAAAAVVDLTMRKMELNEATKVDSIAAINAYEQALRAEIAMVGQDTAAYVALREELERVLAIKNALAGGVTGGGAPGGGAVETGAAALRGGIESFAASLGASSEAAASFAGSIMDQVPLLGAAAGGWMDLLLGLLTSTEGFGDLMEAMNGILNPIIAVLETLFPPLIELVNALTPVIQVIAALVNVALQPFLFVITKILTPAITFVANLIVTIWNAIANALNAILGVFGVKIPTIDRGGPGGGGTDSADQRILGESGGVQVRLDSTGGQPYLIYTADAAPAGSIARQRSVVSALRQAFDNATNDGERSRIQSVLTREEATLNRMTGQETTPTGPTEPEAPRGRIGRLEARRRELQTLINESDSEEDIARYNAELRTVDTEINRLRGLGAPVDEAPPEESAPSGLLPSLRAERAALARQLDAAETPEEIARINDQIRDVDARINELQDLTLRPPEEQEPEAQGLIMRLEAERRGLQDQLMRAETPAEIARLNDGIRAIDAQLNDLRALTNDLPEEIGDEVGDEVEEPLQRLEPDFSFGGTAQSVQLAVATPLLDASIRMLEASQNMQRIFGAVGPDGAPGFSALPAFNSAIERMTPVLERLLSEGVSINVGGGSASLPSSTAYLRGV